MDPIALGKARLLFKGQYARTTTRSQNYDVSHNGTRFQMVKR